MIVFIGDSEFKTHVPDNVTYAKGCIKYIKSKGGSLLSTDQVRATVDAIENGKLKPNAMIRFAPSVGQGCSKRS